MTESAQHIELQKQNLWLLPQKAVFWQEQHMLLIADLHLGKSGHFRSQGIPVPKQINQTNLDVLSILIDSTLAHRIVILGDLFHSQINKEWHQFRHWRASYPELEITLIEGNHDILSAEDYQSAGLTLYEWWLVPPFIMIHDTQSMSSGTAREHYILSGHIHPAVKLTGEGRQTVKFPCFYFGKHQGVLPAFGTFTGTHTIHPSTGDRIYAVTNRQVIPLENSR